MVYMQLHKLYTAIPLPPWLIRPYLPPGVKSSNLAPNHPGGTPVATRQRPRPAPRHGHADRSLGRVQDDYTALVAYRSRENVPMSFSETFLTGAYLRVFEHTAFFYRGPRSEEIGAPVPRKLGPPFMKRRSINEP